MPSQRRPLWRVYLLTTLLMLLLSSVSRSQEVARIPFFNAPPGTTALGGGIRTGQSLYFENNNEELRTRDLIPLYLYEGKWLFAYGTAGGVHFINNDTFEFNLIAGYRFQKLDPDRNEYYEGLEKREQSLDAGLQIGLKRNWGNVRLNWVTDTLNKHKGQEIELSYRYDFEAGPWTFSPFVGWKWQDANLTNYYYGVSEAEATVDRPAYQPGESQWL
jgi:outer membrane protein